MKKYEMMIVTVPEIGNEGKEELKNKLSAAIAKENGKMESFELWRERFKMYHIMRSRGAEKRKYDEGTYFLVNFTIDPLKVSSLKYTLDLDERVLRFMNVVKGEADGVA